MSDYYYLFFVILPMYGYVRYKKYINTAIKTLCVMYICKPTSSFVKKIFNNTYKLDFKINNKLYAFLIKLNNGPNNIEKITNGDNNITSHVEPYFNFYNVDIITKLTPEILGYKNIRIEYFNGDDKIFEKHENVLENIMV